MIAEHQLKSDCSFGRECLDNGMRLDTSLNDWTQIDELSVKSNFSIYEIEQSSINAVTYAT